MEVEADPSLLVVSLDHCISTVDGRNQVKNNCIYGAPIHNNPAGHDTAVLQIPPQIQCLSDPNHSLSRYQQPHLTQFQPIQYSTVQIGYDNVNLHHHQQIHHEQPNEETAGLYHVPQTFHTMHPLQHNLHNLLPPLSPQPPPPPPPQIPPPQPLQEACCDESTYPSDDFEYYKEIERYLLVQEYPAGASENYKKHLKKRAQHYIIINGLLHHGGRKQPKKVVMRKDEQKKMLQKFHIVEETGVHLGVKKMFYLIQEEHFWRGMYVDVANYVKQCDKCSDLADVAKQLKAKEGKGDGDEIMELPDRPMSRESNKNASTQTTPEVWQEVEITLNGPYKMTNSKNEYILGITDTASKFTCACAVPRNGLSTRLAEFTMKMFCIMGFPKIRIVCDDALFETFIAEFMWLMGDLKEPSLLRSEISNSVWLHTLFSSLVEKHPTTWDKEMDKFLFKFNVGKLKFILDPPLLNSPFSALYYHEPFPHASSEDKENVGWAHKNTVKKSPKIVQKCYYCNEEFSSRKSLKFHQQKECREARIQKRNLASRSKKKKDPNEIAKSLASQAEEIEFKPPDTWVESTVSAVKAYLAETKEERRKRGKYQKYTVELQEHMASYALKNGNQKAAQYFSDVLGTHVSDSTIRNLVKSHSVYHPRLKEEIALFAINYGIEKASSYFSERLKRSVPHNLVRKFKSIYVEKLFIKDGKSGGELSDNQNKAYEENMESELNFSVKTRDEIGCYACSNSIQETVRYFSENLGIPVMEETVRKFHKEYLNKHDSGNIPSENITELQPMVNSMNPINTSVSYVPLLQSHLNSQNIFQNNMCFQSTQTGSMIIPQTSTFSYSGSHPFEHTQQIYPQIPDTENIQECQELSHTSENNIAASTCIFNATNLDPQNNHQSLYEIGNPTVKQISQQEKIMETEDLPFDENNSVVQEQEIRDGNKSENAEKGLESEKSSKVKQKRIKKEACPKKRGSYTTYSPELRAEIGKYASEHGSLKAANYFTQQLGHDVPESTARGLKEKYLMKVKHCDVKSLGYSPRGRPLRLGKYDEVVQECLRELVRSGEKVSSFLAITTAKEILNKYDPGLLQENGGSVVLNNTWAKSFLKRIGVRNNS